MPLPNRSAVSIASVNRARFSSAIDDAVLNDLNARAEAFDFCTRINTDDFAVQPNAQIALLLEKLEEIARLGLCRNGDPESDENGFVVPAPVILSGAQRSRRIPLRYFKLAGSLDFARDDGASFGG